MKLCAKFSRNRKIRGYSDLKIEDVCAVHRPRRMWNSAASGNPYCTRVSYFNTVDQWVAELVMVWQIFPVRYNELQDLRIN